MESRNYKIRKISRDEFDIAIEWVAKEGWNLRLYDANCFYKADPDGFFIGLLNDEPTSCISAVACNEQFGFLGFYIVKSGFCSKDIEFRYGERY